MTVLFDNCALNQVHFVFTVFKKNALNLFVDIPVARIQPCLYPAQPTANTISKVKLNQITTVTLLLITVFDISANETQNSNIIIPSRQ